MGPVLDIEARLVEVEAVGVLHRELPGADHPGSRAGVVAPFDLDLEDQLRQLAVGADLARGKARHHLLMGHGEHHFAVAAVLKARQLGADRLVAAALLPDLGRVHDGQGDLRPADGRQLLAEYLLNAQHRLPAEGQVGEDRPGRSGGRSPPAAGTGGRRPRPRPGRPAASRRTAWTSAPLGPPRSFSDSSPCRAEPTRAGPRAPRTRGVAVYRPGPPGAASRTSPPGTPVVALAHSYPGRVSLR